MPLFNRLLALAAPLALAATNAHADVAISTAATQNMTCSGGVCAPTATDAVLNAGDLQTLLASGSVEVMTSGSGVQADNIDVEAAFAWSSASTLALDAYQSITFTNGASDGGTGGVSLITNDGGSGGALFFGRNGNLTFSNLSSSLTINGAVYTLVGTVKSLASDVAANPAGNYALAGDYDASGDGTWKTVPITTYGGLLDGLGHTISNLSIKAVSKTNPVGLIGELDDTGSIAHLGLDKAKIDGLASVTGGFVGHTNKGSLFQISFEGHVTGKKFVGALAGVDGRGPASYASAQGVVSGPETRGYAGGLFGQGTGSIVQSWSGARVTGAYAGGLVGIGGGAISDCYATGSATGATGVAGFAGMTVGLQVDTSYATGRVGSAQYSGGFFGDDQEATYATNAYWDTTTSGVDTGTGNDGNIAGLKGVTTKKLKSGLPAGFNPAIWAEKSGINGGFPYLIANPPPK